MIMRNFGNPHDIWVQGYVLPINDAIFLGTLLALLGVALFCIAAKI